MKEKSKTVKVLQGGYRKGNWFHDPNLPQIRNRSYQSGLARVGRIRSPICVPDLGAVEKDPQKDYQGRSGQSQEMIK